MQNSQQDSIKEIEKILNETSKKMRPLDTLLEVLPGLHLWGVTLSVWMILCVPVLLHFRYRSFSELLDKQNVIIWLVHTIIAIGSGIWIKQAKKDLKKLSKEWHDLKRDLAILYYEQSDYENALIFCGSCNQEVKCKYCKLCDLRWSRMP